MGGGGMDVVGGKYRFSKSRKCSMASVFYCSPALLKYHGVLEENIAGIALHCI